MRHAVVGLRNLTSETTAQKCASPNERRTWVSEDDMVTAFRSAHLEMRGREPMATASSLQSGDVALDRDEIAHVLELKSTVAALVLLGSASAG